MSLWLRDLGFTELWHRRDESEQLHSMHISLDEVLLWELVQQCSDHGSEVKSFLDERLFDTMMGIMPLYNCYSVAWLDTTSYVAFAGAVCRFPFALGKLRVGFMARMRMQKIADRAGALTSAEWVGALALELERVSADAGDRDGASGWRHLSDEARHGRELLLLWGAWGEAYSEARRLVAESVDPMRDFYMWVSRRNQSSVYLTPPIPYA